MGRFFIASAEQGSSKAVLFIVLVMLAPVILHTLGISIVTVNYYLLSYDYLYASIQDVLVHNHILLYSVIHPEMIDSFRIGFGVVLFYSFGFQIKEATD